MKRVLAALVALLPLGGCQRSGPRPATPASTLPAAVAEGKELFELGRLDEALAKLKEMPADPDSLYYQGAVWAKKAESAPLPTPPPAPSPLPRGAEPPAAPEYKPEELAALDLLGRAVGARPDFAAAHLAIADLLAPHAARRFDLEEAEKKRPARRGKTPAPTTAPQAGPDDSPERVIREYQMARLGQLSPEVVAERLIHFAARVGRLEVADAAFQEIVKGQEKPEPYIRYGDFLASEKKDAIAAIDQYKQALVWRPDDDATRGKIADLYLAMGMEHYANQEYAIAEARFKEAAKFVTDKSSPQGVKLQDYMARLRAIRAR